jgi:hypothetical protein
VRLPSDLRAYYGACDGLEGWGGRHPNDWRGFVEFWPFERLEPALAPGAEAWVLPAGLGLSTSYFTFADFLINSRVFSIRLQGDAGAGNPVIEGPYSPSSNVTRLGNSFTDFVAIYLNNPNLFW